MPTIEVNFLAVKIILFQKEFYQKSSFNKLFVLILFKILKDDDGIDDCKSVVVSVTQLTFEDWTMLSLI